jgi:hypothetical protein
MHTFRLKTGGWIRQLAGTVKAIKILCSGFHALDHREVIAAISSFQVNDPFLRPENVNARLPPVRSPKHKPPLAPWKPRCPE